MPVTLVRIPRLVQFDELYGLLGRGSRKSWRVTLWRDVRAGRFPAPVKLGPARIAWHAREVETWIASRPRAAYAPRKGTGEVA